VSHPERLEAEMVTWIEQLQIAGMPLTNEPISAASGLKFAVKRHVE